MSAATDIRRRLLLDVGLALIVGFFCYGFARASAQFMAMTPTIRNGAPWQHGGRFGRPPGTFEQQIAVGEPYTWVALAWVIVLMIGLSVRRLRPRTGYLITVIGATGYLASGLPFGPVLIAPALSLFAMANTMHPRRWAPWVALLIPMIWAGFTSQDHLGLTDPSLYSAVLLLGAVMIMPALFATLRRNRIDASRRTRELDLRRAAYQERLRITRDVHDLIGHSLSVINMQAGVALYVLNKSDLQTGGPERGKVEDSLQAIRSTSKGALDELRATLAVFRGESGETRAPVGGLSRLPELIDSFRAAGRTVKLITDEPTELPGPIDAAAYRIIQEALTNVARHTKDATATVRIDQDADSLTLRVTDDGPPTRIPDDHDGNGLLGMTERAEAVGGTLQAGPNVGGGFLVQARFSLRRSSESPQPSESAHTDDTPQSRSTP